MRYPQRLLLTLAALITVSSCKSEAPKPPPPKVQAVSTQLAEFTEGVDTVSTLEASNLVKLAAQSGGRILELKIRQGDEVAAGQLLVVLDQVEKKAKADNAKANYERYVTWLRRGLRRSRIWIATAPNTSQPRRSSTTAISLHPPPGRLLT